MRLTPKQERALARMSPEAAARRRKTMEDERRNVIRGGLIKDGIDVGYGLGDAARYGEY